MADTKDSCTVFQADCHGRAVDSEKHNHSTVWKAAKCPDIEESRVCKDVPCLSHTYLISTEVNYGYLKSVQNF